MSSRRESYSHTAHTAVLAAAQAEHHLAGWLAALLAGVAADLGSTDPLTAGRPGSWEAELVTRLTKGTVGRDDDLLAEIKEPAQ